jgi:phospholipid/cholesterol/gamma-HCH transport system permease protein
MNWLGNIGRKSTGWLVFSADLFGLLNLTLREMRHVLNPSRRRIFWFLFKRQLYNSGLKATYINTVVAIMLAWLVMSKAYLLLSEEVGAGAVQYYAQFFIIVVIREIGPIVSGVILIARSANAITAEIGHLKLNDEFDVLSSMRISPVFIFLVPVFLSFPLSLLLMFFYFNIVCICFSYLFIFGLYGIDINFADFIKEIVMGISSNEIVISIAKACLGGGLIGLISIQFGIKVGDKFTDISRAISNSISTQFLVFISLNVALSILAYR